MSGNDLKSASRKWSEFRLAVVGGLLASPPECGALAESIMILSEKVWTHPTSGELRLFSFATIERWYYQALKNKQSPIDSLVKQVRSDLGKMRSFADETKGLLQSQYKAHSSWSYQLHFENLRVLLEARGIKVPSYDSARRFLIANGHVKQRREPNRARTGFQKSQIYKDKVEVRSFENPYVNGLWHLDFHHCSREIMTRHGELIKPLALGIIDDHSRLLCHMQWYLSETAEDLIHGFIQALQKRGLPRSLLTDNGSAMMSSEFTSGLKRLSITHETTLPYSPYQNGKQEILWAQVEGRLMAMLENKKVLSLKELNDATQAWAEHEYNKSKHDAIEMSPIERFLKDQDVSRSSPEIEDLKNAFRREASRRMRRSDGTVSIKGKRFEIPERYRHLPQITVSYVDWALDNVHILDAQTGKNLCPIYPVNKEANAQNGRRQRVPAGGTPVAEKEDAIAPLLIKILGEQAASGLPPAYQPKDD